MTFCIQVLLLDEVGLAEHSPDMPLKVLHYMLVDPPIGIVGLSNWTLDSSKMNRAICLQRPEPSVDDMMMTGQNIICTADVDAAADEAAVPLPSLSRQSSNPGLRKISVWLINLSRAFHKIYQAQSENSKGREFIGMRDYYCLLKMFRADLGTNDNSNAGLYQISVPKVLYNVCRNLGGKPNTMDYILSTFYMECFEQRTYLNSSFQSRYEAIKDLAPNHLTLIRDSLNELHNRHLMLLTRNSAALSLLFSCNLLYESDVTVLIGSRFQKDLAELRLIQQINEIKNAMLEGRVVILLNHDSIYESLYDVLNQRYVTRTDPVTGKVRRMLRLAIGPRSQLCPVTDGFKIVVIVEQFHAYDNLDLPLLNRFEKQVFLYDSVLSDGEKNCVTAVTNWAMSLLDDTDLTSLDQLFAGYHAETIPSLILYLSKKLPGDKDLLDMTSVIVVELLDTAKEMLLHISLPIVTLKFPNLLSVSGEKQSISIDLLASLKEHFGYDNASDNTLSETANRGMLTVVMTHSPVGHFTLCKLAHETSLGIQSCELKEIQLSLISSEKQITDLLEDYYSCSSINLGGVENKLLCILCDPLENDLSIIAHVKYLCAKFNSIFVKRHSKLSRAAQQRVFRHVAVVVHLPPGINNLVGRRDYTVDFQAPWAYEFIDDIRPMTNESINEMRDLTTKSAFDLCKKGGIIDLKEVMSSKFQSALARCIAPPIAQCYNYTKKLIPSIQIVKFLLRFPEFMNFLELAVLTCLESCSSSALEQSGRPLLHVEIACTDVFVAGTLREALYSALESVIVQAMSHTLRNIDKNFNLHILGHIAERYVRIPAGASLELTDEDSTNVKIWLSLCSRLLDLSAIGRSCTIVFPSEVHLMDATIVNTGLHEGGLMCRFPFSERIMMLLGADETRRNIEKVAEDIVPGGSMISSVMIKPLRAVLGSFLGGTFWADTVSLISNKERFSSDYSYVNDFIACRVTPFKCLSLDDHVDVFRFLTLATTHLPDEHLDLNLDPVLVQASFWANDTRYFHILSALSTVLKSDASFQILKQNLCERLSVMSRAKCAPGFDNSFSYLIEVDSDICNFFFNYLLHLLEISLKSDDWIALANWEKLYFAMLPDLEGLILGLLSSLSNDRVLPNHDASGVKKLARSVIFPFRTLKAAAIIISEFKIEFSLDLNHTAVQDCVDLLSAALRADILSLERGEKSPMIALCLNKLNKEGMYSVCCSILRRVFTDIVESEYQFFFASAFQLSVTDDLLAQLHNCVVISSTKSQSGDKKLIWLSLAKSLYCFLFSNMRGDFIIHNFLVNRVLEDCEVSVTIVQLYLQWLLDFNELEGRVKQTDPYFSLLPQDSTIFEKVKMFGVARLLLDRFCDNLLQFIGDAGDRIVGSDISAAVIPSDETAILLRNLEANYYVLRCIICRGGAQTMISYLSGRNLPAQFDGMSSLAEVAHKATMINPLACMSLPCTENFAHAVRVVERVLYNSVPVTALTDLIISDEKLQELTITSRISILVAAFSTVIIEAKRNSFPMGSNTATVMQWVTDIRMNSKVNDNIVHNNFKLIVNWILVGQKSYSEDIDVNCKGSWSANRRSLEAHICALVVEFPKCWIATLLISAERFKDYLVPSMPNDELLVLAKALGYVGWYTCVNGHPYVVGNCTYPMETARCSICNSRIGGENHETVVGTKRFDPHSRPQCMGYNLTAAKHSDAYDLQDGSRCNAVTSTILRYIIHLSLAMSMSLSEANALSVHEFLGIKGFNPLNAYKELVTLMEKDWAELKKRSSYGDADLSMALHLTLDLYAMEIRKGNFSSISYRLDTEDARDIFERSFEAICRRYFMQSSSLSEIREAASTLSGLSQFTAIRKCLGNAEASVYLTGENELSIQQLMNARLLRYRESVNFNAFMFHFGLQRENTFMFPLLSAILKTEEKLSLIKHISDILAWHSVLFRALKPGSVTRSEALNISNAGVISNLPIDNQAAASLILDKYCVAFNRTLPLVPFLFECNANPFLASNNEVDLSGSQRSDGSGDRMSPNTSIKFSLPSIISGEQDATGLCTIQIINALMQTHNDVLEGLISLAAPISSKDFTKEGVKITETLAPLAKGKKKKVAVTTFRTDLNVLNRRLIHYDRKIHLMPIVYAFAKQNLGCTEGSLDGFDYSRIEQSLSRSLLGTAELINVHVTQFQYAGELQNTGVLRMLQERVLQEPLSLSLLERIQREVDTKVRLVRLLTQVEECVAFVVSTGNTGVMDVDSTMLLETYINDILLVSKASWAEISCPTISAHVQLCHLRALLQALELWLLGDPLDAVVLRYKESFEGVVSDEDLRAVAAAEGSTVLMAGLFDVLTEQLCRDTWPANACLKEYVGYRDEDICNLLAYEIFPDVLCLCHAHAVYKFIQSLSAS